jgi:hypothetical protein
VPPDIRGNALPGGHYFSAAADRLKKVIKKTFTNRGGEPFKS